MRAAEERDLSPLTTPSYPARRGQSEPDGALRTPFQRDRDRIVHCKAFRRLKYKTQVFINRQADHQRTRLSHSLEVAQVARAAGSASGWKSSGKSRVTNRTLPVSM